MRDPFVVTHNLPPYPRPLSLMFIVADGRRSLSEEAAAFEARMAAARRSLIESLYKLAQARAAHKRTEEFDAQKARVAA